MSLQISHGFRHVADDNRCIYLDNLDRCWLAVRSSHRSRMTFFASIRRQEFTHHGGCGPHPHVWTVPRDYATEFFQAWETYASMRAGAKRGGDKTGRRTSRKAEERHAKIRLRVEALPREIKSQGFDAIASELSKTGDPVSGDAVRRASDRP